MFLVLFLNQPFSFSQTERIAVVRCLEGRHLKWLRAKGKKNAHNTDVCPFLWKFTATIFSVLLTLLSDRSQAISSFMDGSFLSNKCINFLSKAFWFCSSRPASPYLTSLINEPKHSKLGEGLRVFCLHSCRLALLSVIY